MINRRDISIKIVRDNKILWTPFALVLLVLSPALIIKAVWDEMKDDILEAYKQAIDLLLWRVK